MSTIKSVHLSNRKLSKLARRVREEEEAKIMGSERTIPKPARYLDKEGKKEFKRFVKLHEHLSEADSEDLSQLCQYIVLHRDAVKQTRELDVMSDEYGKHLTNLLKLDKLISGYMVQLCLTYKERLRLANEIAKIKIEEQKLAMMESPKVQEVNPLLAVLEATKNGK